MSSADVARGRQSYSQAAESQRDARFVPERGWTECIPSLDSFTMAGRKGVGREDLWSNPFWSSGPCSAEAAPKVYPCMCVRAGCPVLGAGHVGRPGRAAGRDISHPFQPIPRSLPTCSKVFPAGGGGGWLLAAPSHRVLSVPRCLGRSGRVVRTVLL